MECLSSVDDLLREKIIESTRHDDELWSSPRRNRRESAHAFFQYPAMMVPAVQRRAIQIITDIQPGVNYLLDPFVGAGTAIVAGLYCGLNCYGQDINPLAILLSRSKTDSLISTSISDKVYQVLSIARTDTSRRIETAFPNLDKWFNRDVALELDKLRRAIRQENDIKARRFLWVSLAETVRLTSNDRTSTYKLHARPPHETASRVLSPITVFTSLVERNLEDLEEYAQAMEQAGYLHQGRLRRVVQTQLQDTASGIIPSGQVQDGLYDLLVTSPPYGDNTSTVSYGQHAYLPLQWIDLEDVDHLADSSFLRSTYEIDSRSLGGRRARELDAQVELLRHKSKQLAVTFDQLRNTPRDRTSRVAAFYQDFDKCLDHIVKSLRSNAYMAWTISNRSVGGIEIRTNEVLGELLQARGVELVTQVARQILHKRMPSRNAIASTMRNEQILFFRKVTPMGENL